jgi:hypothetical protein
VDLEQNEEEKSMTRLGFGLGLAGVLGLLATGAGAATNIPARAGLPFYAYVGTQAEREAELLKFQSDSGSGYWICANNDAGWWTIPVPLTHGLATVNGVQRVKVGTVQSNLVTYSSVGDLFASGGLTTASSLGTVSVPSGGSAEVESLLTYNNQLFKNNCLGSIKITQ